MYNLDKRKMYIIICLIVVFLIFTSKTELLNLLLSLPGVILAITFHEFAHAYAAYKLGDDTARNQGRMTLNPMAHLDPLGILMLATVHFGWGRPVEVNSNNFTRKTTVEKGNAIVSLAGPVMNFLLAIILITIYYALIIFVPGIKETSNNLIFLGFNMIIYAAMINIGLGVFNLIPIPPLDGSKIFRVLLPAKAKYWLDTNETTIYIAFLVLWATGVLGDIVSPINIKIFELLLIGIGKIFTLFM